VSVPGPSGGSTLVSLEPGASLAEARNVKRRRMAAGRPLPADTGGRPPSTVHELAVLYLRDREPLLAPATIRTTAEGYRLRVAPHFGATPLERLSRPAVERWVGRLLETGSSVHATRKALAALKVMCSYAVELGALAANPCSRVLVPAPPSDGLRPVERVLSPAELERLLAACETAREEAIVRLAAESGLRSGEVRGLRWPDVELAALRLHVRRSVWRDVLKVPKGRRARRVAITPELGATLSRLYAENVVERGLPAEGYVIAGRFGGARARVTFHGLRHTAASAMLSAGVPAVVVAAQLGHASSAITHAVYEHLLEDAALDAAVRSVRVAGSVAGNNGRAAETARKPA
jgi:integrase